MIPLKYITGDGRVIHLDGVHAVSGVPNGIYSYDYDIDVALGMSSATSSPRDIDVDTVAMSKDAVRSMVSAFTADIAAARYGRLEIANTWIDCIVSKWRTRAISDLVTLTLTLTFKDVVWRSDYAYEFVPVKTVGGSNYPYNYPTNYGTGGTLSLLHVDSPMGADAVIEIYGPASRPSISIGSNTYHVDVEVPEGSTLIIDGVAKTVEMHDAYGTVTNEFAHAERGEGAGKGSYIFEPITAGDNDVSWNKSFKFTVTACERGMMPAWI